MNSKTQKLTAALMTGCFCILVFAGLAYFFIRLEEAPGFLRFLYGAIFTGLCFGMSSVVTERVREIRKGEEDDLNNY